ncbi:hypothetical protein [Candidatus Sodalis pierantonius]|uniref:hypothetical protein n=1 Tax=Candidatus Sodalis pierantonii TaxID=1486991 RepID=UPI00130E4B51|nr:hypothetical protein [Candidatus Sodalis pierantonius]
MLLLETMATGDPMKAYWLLLTVLLLTGCSGMGGILFNLPNAGDVCPHGRDVFTNQCHD